MTEVLAVDSISGTFKLEFNDGFVYNLAAASSGEAARWIEALEERIEWSSQFKALPPPPPPPTPAVSANTSATGNSSSSSAVAGNKKVEPTVAAAAGGKQAGGGKAARPKRGRGRGNDDDDDDDDDNAGDSASVEAPPPPPGTTTTGAGERVGVGGTLGVAVGEGIVAVVNEVPTAASVTLEACSPP